jgi:hypothetical protein
MNERIKELAEQAWESITVQDALDDEALEKFDQKFAELIVRECLSVGEDVANADGTGLWFNAYMSGVEEVKRRIKQHFGVEE